MRPRLLSLIAILIALPACRLGPKYQRPATTPPPTFRGADQPSPAASTEKSFGDLAWNDVVKDEQLQSLIRTALEKNFDVLIAAARVLEARAALTSTRSNQFPSVDANAAYTNTRIAERGSVPLPPGSASNRDFTQLSLDLGWELDIWGRLRNATASARAQLLATEEARHVVRQTLVAEVARAYYELLALDLSLQFSRKALSIREESLRIVQLRFERGIVAEIELRQAEILVRSARASIADTERLTEQKENQISILLGQNPGPIQRGRALLDQSLASTLPEGLPSSILERRPDLRRAEQYLVSANAQVGVAKAAYFPRIALTASTGFESAALSDLFSGANHTWVFGPVGSLPIFNAGRIRAGVRSAEARKEQALLQYQQAVQQAFREVSDSLIGYRKLAEFRKEQEALVESVRAAVRVADLRYKGGITSYLEYLDTQRQSLDAELRFAQARRDELVSLILLYRSLGGAWQ